MLRSVRYGCSGAVLAGVVGGLVAWSHVDKTVTLVVDGQSRRVTTTSATVGDVLRAAGYTDGSHDLVAPSLGSAVHNGSTIVFRRGRLLHLDVDGAAQYVWTTAPTVADALSQLGYSTADFTSVSRSRRLPLTPTDISVRTPKLVSLKVDGSTQTITTTDETVGQLLSDMSIALGPGDKVSVPQGDAISEGDKIVVSRIVHTTMMKTQPIPYSTKQLHDAALTDGVTKVIKPGKNGLAEVTYAMVYVDGKVAGQTKIQTVVLQSPSSQVEHVGTKKTTSGTDFVAPSPGSVKAIAQQMLVARGWGTEQQFSCLDSLWSHESGWRVNAGNRSSGAYGIPQALPGDKMASVASDWRTNPVTQITWGLDYIAGRYGTPCDAWSAWQAHGGWY